MSVGRRIDQLRLRSVCGHWKRRVSLPSQRWQSRRVLQHRQLHPSRRLHGALCCPASVLIATIWQPPTPAPTPSPLCKCNATAAASACPQSGNQFQNRASVTYDCGQCGSEAFVCDQQGGTRGGYCGNNAAPVDCVVSTSAPTPQPTPAPTPNPLCNCAANMTRALESACEQRGNAFNGRPPFNYDCGQCAGGSSAFRCDTQGTTVGAYCGNAPAVQCSVPTGAPTPAPPTPMP